LRKETCLKLLPALLAEKSEITEAALYRHFPSKRAIYAELFSFCDNAIFNKCAELKKLDLSSKDKVKNTFIFFMLFIEKNKGFARLLSREALSTDEKNVSDAVKSIF
jgi:TetR/AcrR family transcriptional regulator